MSTNLNLHARLAIERALDEYAAALHEYASRLSPVNNVAAAGSKVRAQARATAKIDDRAPEVLRGLVATVYVLAKQAEMLREAGHDRTADSNLRRAHEAIELARYTLLDET